MRKQIIGLVSLAPITIMRIILGSLLGFLIHKFTEKSSKNKPRQNWEHYYKEMHMNNDDKIWNE